MHLGLLTIDYFLTRCLSRRGWEQNTAYYQLTTWANGTNQLRASLDENETRAMFCLLWGALLWPIKNYPVCGQQRDSKKPKLPPKIAALGKTHCLEKSRIYDGSGLGLLAINTEVTKSQRNRRRQRRLQIFLKNFTFKVWEIYVK